MDSKVKVIGYRLTVIGFFLAALLLSGCKENKWIDWKTQNEMWLENNKNRPGVVVAESGLQYKIIADPVPQDARPNETSTIVCDYDLYLITGWNTNPSKRKALQSGKGVSLSLPSTITGFAEGCHKIHNHGDIELYIPAYLGYDAEKYENDKYSEAEGYGTEGTTGYIPPYSTLIYILHISNVTGD